jgi:uncharacterized protein
MSVSAGDLFSDVDLQACCPSVRVSNYPQGLIDVLLAAPAGPWMYTGALENYPQLIERMASLRPLWGNSADCVRRVRDPMAVFHALHRHDLVAPRVANSPDDLPTDGSWLVKRRHSAGGSGVSPWQGSSATGPEVYFQQRIEGRTCGAVYLAAAGRSVFLGATQQILGDDASDGHDFRYSGSIGPLQLEPTIVNGLDRVGQALAAEFQLVGLFGVDVVLANEAVWPVEVNPRYTASIEILERAAGRSLITWHGRVCTGGALPSSGEAMWDSHPQKSILWGKRIVYARRAIEIGAGLSARLLATIAGTDDPLLADIPAAGSRIDIGRPALTVFANGKTIGEVQSALSDRVEEVEQLLYRGD